MDEVSDPEIEAKIIKVLIDKGSQLLKEVVGADAADRLSEMKDLKAPEKAAVRRCVPLDDEQYKLAKKG